MITAGCGGRGDAGGYLGDLENREFPTNSHEVDVIIIAVGTPIAERPRTEPDVRHSRIRLLPRVLDPSSTVGAGAAGSQPAAAVSSF